MIKNKAASDRPNISEELLRTTRLTYIGVTVRSVMIETASAKAAKVK